MSNDIRNEIKSYIAKSGMTLTDIISEYNKTHEPTTTQNISNKLTRGTIKYSDIQNADSEYLAVKYYAPIYFFAQRWLFSGALSEERKRH